MSTPNRGPTLPLDVEPGRRHEQSWSDLADADFDHPREPMTLGGVLWLLAVMLASASLMIGLLMWFLDELAR